MVSRPRELAFPRYHCAGNTPSFVNLPNGETRFPAQAVARRRLARDTRGLPGRIKPDASFSYSLSQRVLFDMAGDLGGQFQHVQNVTNVFPQAPRRALGRAC
jgi:hypothetical protein